MTLLSLLITPLVLHMNDFFKIGRHAFSVLAGQWAAVGYGIVDNAIAGHIDKTALSALSLGIAIYMSVFIGLMGIVQAILPIAGQLYGAKRYTEIGYQCRQTFYLAIGVSIIGILCLMFPGPLLQLADAPPEKEALVRDYLHMLALGFVPAVLFRIYASLSQAISRPLFVTVLQIIGLVIKIPLTWLLAVQWEMGIAGCGVSTTMLNTLFFIIAVVMLIKHPVYRPFHIIQRLEPPAAKDQVALLKLGIPMGLSYFIEVTGTTFMAIFIARFHSDAYASGHQIVGSIAGAVYMIPLSISIASSAIVAQYLGACNYIAARSAGYKGISMAIICAIAAGLLVYFCQQPIIGIYTTDPDVIVVASSLIIFIALYQLADATQITAAFILRAYKIAILPTILYAVALWGVGLGGGYTIAFNLTGHSPEFLQGPAGFWFGNAVSLAAIAIALVMLFNHISKKLIAEEKHLVSEAIPV